MTRSTTLVGGGGREVKDLGLGWDLPDKLTIPF